MKQKIVRKILRVNYAKRYLYSLPPSDILCKYTHKHDCSQHFKMSQQCLLNKKLEIISWNSVMGFITTFHTTNPLVCIFILRNCTDVEKLLKYLLKGPN